MTERDKNHLEILHILEGEKVKVFLWPGSYLVGTLAIREQPTGEEAFYLDLINGYVEFSLYQVTVVADFQIHLY